METVILMSNVGYLRGIDGSLQQHMRFAHRHFYSPRKVQEACIAQVRGIMESERPDICCFVEIDKGSKKAKGFNQLEALACEQYAFYDIDNKYGPTSHLRHLPLMHGKSNGFIARRKLPYEKIYFTHGTKKLIYKLSLEPEVTLFFAHFSLKQKVRAQQLAQIQQLLRETNGEVIVLGDFNIKSGFQELAPLINENNLKLLNEEHVPTFRFHTFQMPLDICLCSQGIAQRASLRVIPQPYSDHEALLLTLR